MDREPEELQFLGAAGICVEAHKLVLSCRRLFAQITVALILPLSCLFLAHIHISHMIFYKIDRNLDALEDAPEGSAAESSLLSRVFSDWASYLLYKACYLLAVLVFSLLSTSAVVYTIACVYTAKDLGFRRVMTVVPRVWRRLMVTFLWNFAILLGYNTGAALLAVIALLVLGPESPAGLVLLVVVLVFYLAGLVYISVVWHLASVISVLEEAYGLEAMKKSKALIRGKAWPVVGIFLVFQLLFAGTEVWFRMAVVEGKGAAGVSGRVVLGAVILVVLSGVVLFGLVVQTVVYFVCKSYHHESIDKSILKDHLEEYLGEYVPLKEKDVQLEQFHV